MTPVAFVREGSVRARVPVVSDPFRIGRDLACDLVVDDPRVAPVHARVRHLKGEYVLSAEGGATLLVNGRRAPLIPLRHGDLLTLTVAEDRRPLCLRFAWSMEDAYLPPGASLGGTWMAHPAFARAWDDGPGRFGPPRPLAGRDPARLSLGRDPEGGGDVVVKVLGVLRSPEEADRWLRLLAAVGGAPHGNLALVLDGGVAPRGGTAVRWMALRHEAGTSAADAIRDGPLPARAALSALGAAARGVAHLHRRGVVHRDVAPGNLLLRAGGGALLLDYGSAFLAAEGAPPSRGVVGTPGYVAPEEVLEGGAAVGPAADVHGLAALGYALLTGGPPVVGADVLESLALAGTPPARPTDLGVRIPEAFEGVLLDALSRRPGERPDAVAFERAVAFAEASVAVGGSP